MVVALLAYWVGLCNASAFYDPGAQRWLNRDPIGESGGINLHQFVANNPTSFIDSYGHDRSVLLPPGTSGPPGYTQCGQIGTQILWCGPHKPPVSPPSNPQPPSPKPPCPPKNPEDCWGSLPSDKLATGLKGIPVLAAAQAMETGCLDCCGANFFTGNVDDYNKCVANCEAKKTAMIGIGKTGGGVKGF